MCNILTIIINIDSIGVVSNQRLHSHLNFCMLFIIYDRLLIFEHDLQKKIKVFLMIYYIDTYDFLVVKTKL